MSEEQQQNIFKPEKTPRRGRITWKEAFYLLKRVALHRFRLKHFPEPESKPRETEHQQQPQIAPLPPPLPTHTEAGERIIYPRRTLDQARKNYLTIIYLNDQANLRPLDRNVGSELKVDDLAKSILNGILNEIRSRSGSSSSASHHEAPAVIKPKTIDGYDLDEKGQRTNNRDDEYPQTSRNEQRIKYVVDRQPPTLSIRSLLGDELGTGKILTSKPSIVLGQEESKRPSKGSKEPLQKQDLSIDVFASDSNVFEPYRSLVDRKPLVKKPESENVPKVRAEPEFPVRKPEKDHIPTIRKPVEREERREKVFVSLPTPRSTNEVKIEHRKEPPPKKPAHEEPPTPRDDTKRETRDAFRPKREKEEEEEWKYTPNLEDHIRRPAREKREIFKPKIVRGEKDEKEKIDEDKQRQTRFVIKPKPIEKPKEPSGDKSSSLQGDKPSISRRKVPGKSDDKKSPIRKVPQSDKKGQPKKPTERDHRVRTEEGEEEEPENEVEDENTDDNEMKLTLPFVDDSKAFTEPSDLIEETHAKDENEDEGEGFGEDEGQGEEELEELEDSGDKENLKGEIVSDIVDDVLDEVSKLIERPVVERVEELGDNLSDRVQIKTPFQSLEDEVVLKDIDKDKDKETDQERQKEERYTDVTSPLEEQEEEEDAIKETEQSPVPEDDSKEPSKISESKELKKPDELDEQPEDLEEDVEKTDEEVDRQEVGENEEQAKEDAKEDESEVESEPEIKELIKDEKERNEKPAPTSPKSSQSSKQSKKGSLIPRVYSPILFGTKKKVGKDEESESSEESEEEGDDKPKSTEPTESPTKIGLESVLDEETTKQEGEGEGEEEEDEEGVSTIKRGTEFRPLIESPKSESSEHESPDLTNPDEDEIKDETLDQEAVPGEDAENADVSEIDRIERQQPVEDQSQPIVPSRPQTNLAKKKREKEKPEIDEAFFYDYNELVFKPVISEESNLSEDLLQLYNSFGYDCNKRSNLYLIDPETLMFSAGNLVVMLNIKTKQQKYLRTLSGGAVGAIAVHPSRRYFAVGEKGNLPNINIYEYPSLKLYRILRNGTIRGYAHLDFDPTGNLLASLGTAPDFMLTIWDWRQEKIVLRTKAFSQDVFKVTFSKDLTGILTSAGTGHIKFWKMAHTFTGFKLQGDLGKFGKTEISDIEGYAELPDGKVLSGSEWGNMLLWDGGLIQTEICRKKNKPCHVGPIQQIILNESDVYTIGTDGWVRVWDFETIDTSEPSEEGVKLELEPINELKVGTNVSLRSMVKDELHNEESSIWYAQDSNGGIWRLDLSFSAASESPKQLFSYHSGSINGIETCSLAHLFVTTADDGSVRVVDYANGVVVAQRKFNSPGTCIKWLSTSVDPEGGTIAVGFNDGVLRFLKLVPKNDQQFDLVLIEAFKPHTKAIRAIAVDSKSSIIATGSDDPSVFFFSNKKNVRVPIGFVNLPSPVTYMTWTPADYESNRLLVCMKDGSVYEFEAPIEGKYDTSKSYLIEMSLKSRKYTFKSIKSRLRHEEEMERKRIEEEERKKKEEEERRLRGIDEEEEKAKAAKKGKKGQQKKESKASEEQQTTAGETAAAAEGEGGGSGEGSNEEQGAKKEEPAPEEAPPAAAPEDEWKPYIPEVPSKIHWAVYSSPNTFWLSMDDYDAGYLYECRFLDEANKAKLANSDKIDEPFRAVPVIRSDITHSEDIPLSSIVFNNKKTYCAIGEKNGVVRISPMPESKQLEDVKHYWSYGFHDCDYGHITQMCFSYDEKFLFSVGADSNIFGILFNATLDDLERARTQKIRLACQTQVKNVTDIDDPMAYSIEEAKLKSESDKTIANAEAKKQDMRDKIGDLRRAFKELLDKNDQLVPRLRLEKNDFQIEDSIKDHVYQQVQSKVDLTYRELAWQSEKCRLLLDKLKTRFKDVIECDHIVVYTFQQAESIFVSSFRTVTLPKDMEQYKSELEKQYFAKMLEKQKNKENIDNLEKEIRLKLYGIRKSSVDLIMNELEQKLSDAKSDVTDLIIDQLSATESGGNDDQLLIPPGLSATDQMKRIFGRLRGNTAAKVERALKKMEEKKMKRLRRKKEWKDLMDSRLPDDYENPEDVASIKYAQDNLGDFKLKSSDDYVVPENQRMNVFRAVERLMLIKEFIHKNQMIFNKKLLSLRNKKMSLIDEINSSIDRLQQISFLLGQSKSSENRLTRLELRPEEIPEKKYEYTRDKLIEFKKEMEIKASKAAEEEAQSLSVGGLGGFSAAAAAPAPQTQAGSAKKQADAPLSNDTKSTSSIYEGLKPIWQNRETMSPLMTQIVQAKEIRLMYEQKELYKSIEEKTMLFDAELKALRHERARIAIFMKNADLRHVTIYEEFMLLREFEKTENELEMKLTKKKEEFLEMQTKLADAQLKIDNKRKDLEKLDESYKQLAHTFSHMIHDETKYNDFLARVYKRKIKRKKKVEGQEEDEESEEESIESDSDDEDFDEEDEDSDGEGKEQLDLDICPSGLKQELFDQVCQLREKRLDLDEQIAEEKRTLEQLKKDQDTLVKKAKLVENSLKQAQHELENFQREKQKKINNLDIVVMLRLNQIEYLKDGRLPSDLSASLAFDSRDLERLQRRIKELQVEKAAEKKLFKSLKERHTNLIRDKKKMDEYVEKLDEVCNKMMVDRFGKLVDVEKLELIAVNQQIEELKQRLAENEFDHEKVMQDWLNKISVEKDEEIELIKANTSRINEMIDIMSGTKGTETRLDAKQTSLGEELAGTNKKEIEERQRLHTLVQLQAQEIEALKAEISILSRKGGHILPPTQPPMSQIQT